MKNKLLKCFSLVLLALWTIHDVSAQNIAVKGTVTDAKGEPLIGVSVLQKGTTNGMITNLDGEFSLNLPRTATLVFSYVGFITQEIQVNNRTTINVTLAEDAELLEEVVVIGYGTQRREAVTGSVASMRGDALREVPSNDITGAIAGRVAGIDMTAVDSKPGSSMQIRIRGTRSLSASNDPLIVLDGIPFMGTISDISPSSIKSMDILKDASSTAIYGSRGANGVIIITTDKGQQGNDARVQYNAYVGLKTIFAKYPMMNGPEFTALREAAGGAWGADESPENNIDWQDLLYKNGISQNHDISVSGGTKGGAYSVGLGYYHDEAVVPLQAYDRITLRASIDQSVGNYFKFGVTTNSNYNYTSGSQVGLYAVLCSTPVANPYNADGTMKDVFQMQMDKQWTYTREKIEAASDRWKNETRAFASYNSAYAEIKFPWIEGLKYRMNLGANIRYAFNGSFTGKGVNTDNPTNPNSASQDHRLNLNWTVENLLTYEKVIGNHNINAVAMYSAEQTTSSRMNASAQSIQNEQFLYWNLGRANGEKTINAGNQDYWQAGLMSYMGRVIYQYDNRYMASVSFRGDGSSRLAKGHQWITYPAISAGWNISREAFMKDFTWLDMLKLRVGYGKTSNQSISPYSTLGVLSTRNYNFGDTYATGYYVTTLPNPALGWEYSDTWNFGVDFGLFAGRLTGTLEYYVQNTSELLLNLGLPQTSGVSGYTANIGKTRNKGIELTLNGTIIQNKEWTWDAGINIYANRNKLVALASDDPDGKDEGNGWFVGYPIDVIYDYEYDGLWNKNDPDFQYLDILEPGGNEGMIKVKYNIERDANGKPVRKIGPDDRTIRSLEPDFMGGFNTRVAYKNFDLSIVGSFRVGGILLTTLNTDASYLNMMSSRRNNIKVDYWTPENTDAKYPKPGGISSSDNPKYIRSLGEFDGTYLKLRTITLGYNFESIPWVKKSLGVQRLRAYMTIQNPFVIYSKFTSEFGLDPETNSYGNQNTATGGYNSRFATVGFNTPQTRNYMFGINLTF